ncbi:MAG TPA: hypothetical protein VF250_10805 [Conexibacter sp.]
MRPLRNLLNELVERRLWPVALLLVLALVAVPLLLAKPAASTDDGAPAATTPPAAQAAAAAAARAPGDTPPGGEPVVAVAQADEPSAPLRGRAKNPFRQQHLEATSTTTASTAGVVSSAGGSDTSGSAGGGGAGGDSDGQTPSSPQQTYSYATIDVRFGKAGLKLRKLDDVPRLTPLPSAAEPIVVFLGMRADRQTAVFLVSTDVHAQGEGRCVPSRKTCEAIVLKRGDVALLDFADADGSVTQYELDLVDVTVHETTSKALASRAYARTSRAGARLLEGARVRSSSSVVVRRTRIPFRYAERRGVLHIAPWASERARMGRAHGRLSSASLADLP